MADEITKLNVTSTATPGQSASADASADDANTDPFASAKEELSSRYALLPEEIKAVITDAKYQEKLFELAKAQKLTYEQLGTLETETTMVLLGMTKPADYRNELQMELKKNDAEIDAIVAAVNEQVFAPIRSSLERLYSAKKDPADYIPDSIIGGETKVKPAEPIFPPTPTPTPTPTPAPVVNAIQNPMPTPPTAPRAATLGSMQFPSSLTSLEKNVLEKTGVVINSTPAPQAPIASTSMPDRKDLLASIENPSSIKREYVAPAAAPAVTAPKPLTAGPVISATKTTDYSMPAAAPSVPPAAPRTTDPYREPIN